MKFLLAAISLVLLSTISFAKTENILITVAKDNADKIYAKKMCDIIHQSISLSNNGSIDSKCIWLKNNEITNQDVNKELRNNIYIFHIDLREFNDGKKVLRIINQEREDETDFSQLSWTIDQSSKDSEIKISKLIKHAFDTRENLSSIKMNLLANAAHLSNEIELKSNGVFIDRFSGEEISPQTAYERFKDESSKNKQYLRTGIEIAGILGFAAINYQIQREAMSRDWDFPSILESWNAKIKTSNGYKFDDNTHSVNEGHAYAGMVYYMIARSNGFTSLESALINLTASSAWEFLIEYREVVSINDQVLTPLGGFAIGEAYHQIAKIFKKRKGSIINTALSTMFDSPTAMNNWIDKRYNGKNSEEFNSNFWSNIDIEASLISNPKNSNQKDGRLTFDAQIINIESFEEEGQAKKIITDTTFSQILYSFPVNQSSAMDDFKFTVKNVLAAYYQKDLTRDQKGNLTGYNFIIGPSNGVEFYETNSKSNPNVKEDWMSIVNIFGSTMRLDYFKNGFKISCTIDLFADFAMVRSYAIDQYKIDKSINGLTSVISNNNYYYGLGNTKAFGLNISKGKIDIGLKVSAHNFNSINSRYRDSETVDQKLDLTDSRIVSEIYITYKLSQNLKFKASVEKINRTGGIDNFGLFEGTEVKKMGTLIYKFR